MSRHAARGLGSQAAIAGEIFLDTLPRPLVHERAVPRTAGVPRRARVTAASRRPSLQDDLPEEEAAWLADRARVRILDIFGDRPSAVAVLERRIRGPHG